VVGEAEQAAGVVEQGRGELAENKARKGAVGMLTIGDELEGEGMMMGSVLTLVSWKMGLSVLVSVAAPWGPLPVLSLLNLLPPGSCTRLRWQMLLLVQLPVVPGPLSHMLHSALLSFVSF
jgi:hypothetical protein